MELFGTKSTKQKTHQNNNVPYESIQDNTFKNFEKSSLPKLDGTKNGTKKGAKSTKQKTQNYFHKNIPIQTNNNSKKSKTDLIPIVIAVIMHLLLRLHN